MDVHNKKRISEVVKLCERNSQNFYNGVYIHLYQSLPPWVNSIKKSNTKDYAAYVGYVHGAKIARVQFETHCILTLVGTKVVGFLLYHVQRNAAKPMLEILYFIVDKDHRRKKHGSNMLQAILRSYMIDAKKLEEGDVAENCADLKVGKEYGRVSCITASMHRNASMPANFAFYTKNGFKNIEDIPEFGGYQDDPEHFLSMGWVASPVS